jgi:hypothetical protein
VAAIERIFRIGLLELHFRDENYTGCATANGAGQDAPRCPDDPAVTRAARSLLTHDGST